jgi:predicted ester cyclase
MTVDTNKALGRKFIELSAAGDETGLENLFDPRAIFHHAGLPNLDVKAYRELDEDNHTAFPDMRWTIDELIGEGDYVVARTTWRGTQRGPWQNIPASNKQVVMPMVLIFRLSNGRISELWAEYDQLNLMVQMGAVKSPQMMRRE